MTKILLFVLACIALPVVSFLLMRRKSSGQKLTAHQKGWAAAYLDLAAVGAKRVGQGEAEKSLFFDCDFEETIDGHRTRLLTCNVKIADDDEENGGLEVRCYLSKLLDKPRYRFKLISKEWVLEGDEHAQSDLGARVAAVFVLLDGTSKPADLPAPETPAPPPVQNGAPS